MSALLEKEADPTGGDIGACEYIRVNVVRWPNSWPLLKLSWTDDSSFRMTGSRSRIGTLFVCRIMGGMNTEFDILLCGRGPQERDELKRRSSGRQGQTTFQRR